MVVMGVARRGRRMVVVGWRQSGCMYTPTLVCSFSRDLKTGVHVKITNLTAKQRFFERKKGFASNCL
jgi:hypothetical protein